MTTSSPEATPAGSAPKRILFVCTGNSCRSPMAEALFRARAGRDFGWVAESAGVAAWPGQPASAEAVEVLREQGVDLGGHRSRPADAEAVQSADLVVAMTEAHRRELVRRFPDAAERIRILASFGTGAGSDIGDPVGLSLDAYRRCRDTIDSALSDLLLVLREPSAVHPAVSQPEPQTMNLVIGCDHGGFALKQRLVAHLESRGHQVTDAGTDSASSADYPDFAAAVCRAVTRGQADQGILICRTGMGMSIASNKFPSIRAALCLTPDMVRLARQHNDANVLVLGADLLQPPEAEALLDVWLDTPGAEEPRHLRRVHKVAGLAAEAVEVDRFWPRDPELFDAIGLERIRQDENLELIASENYASSAVRAAQGGVMTNKYAEGYPGKRWYNGCEYVDVAERLALRRVKELFGAEHANVQPHCGSTANMAVYFSVLQPGDTILAMSLDQGGHLTHGHPMNFSGRLFKIVPYGVDKETERIDYDEVQKLAETHRPKLVCAGASAYSREFDFPRLRQICDAVGAYLMVDMAHIAGLVAGGVHSSPVAYADFVTSTTHKTLRGPRGGIVLCREKYGADIDKQVFPGLQGGPLMHVIAAKAVAFGEALRPEFKAYARQVVENARTLAAAMVGLGFRIVSGGTDNHLMLVDVSTRSLTGKASASILDVAGITVNKNAIPFDTKSPFVTSGIRIGTPAVTTRGMGETEMKAIAALIGQVLDRPDDADAAREVKTQVQALTRGFPLP